MSASAAGRRASLFLPPPHPSRPSFACCDRGAIGFSGSTLTSAPGNAGVPPAPGRLGGRARWVAVPTVAVMEAPRLLGAGRRPGWGFTLGSPLDGWGWGLFGFGYPRRERADAPRPPEGSPTTRHSRRDGQSPRCVLARPAPKRSPGSPLAGWRGARKQAGHSGPCRTGSGRRRCDLCREGRGRPGGRQVPRARWVSRVAARGVGRVLDCNRDSCRFGGRERAGGAGTRGGEYRG